MLQPYRQIRCGLSLSDSLRLELVDKTGVIGAVFRHWEERIIGESVGEVVPRLRGCELLLRPDLFGRMSRYFDQPLVMVTQPLRSSKATLHNLKPPAGSMTERGDGPTGEGADAQGRPSHQYSGGEPAAVT